MMKWIESLNIRSLDVSIMWIACSITFSCWSVRRNQSI